MKWAIGLAAAMGLAAIGSNAHAGEAAAAMPAAKDAGIRYGQALGVLEVCYGSKLTDKAKALEQAYAGGDLEAFKASAASVYEAWVKVRACSNQKDPNTCKIIMDRSCQMAEGEIGPSGSAMPGLVEFNKP